MVAGVAGGIADALRLDSSLVRIIWAILIPLSGGFMLLLYVVMAIVVPPAPPRVAAAAAGTQEADPDAPATATIGAPAEPPRIRGNAGVLLGAVLIIVGIWFLADQYLGIDWSRIWPIAIIGLGVLLLLVALRRD
jgi:phage shock protein C